MHLAGHADGYFMTEAHHQLRREVRGFAEREVAPHVARMESSRAVEHDLARMVAKRGWIGATIDPRYGGMGFGHLAKTIIIEELARVSGAVGAIAQASQLGVAKIVHFGNEEQKRQWLPRISAGDCLPTIAVTEPQSGGQVLGMTSTAQREGDHYILNGRKVFVGNSHIGDLHGVVVRTGPGSRGLSAFLVESTAPGLTLAPHQPAMGLHGFSFGELVFDDCRVPATSLLGTEGRGLDVAYSSSVLYGRPNLTAVALGIHQAVVEQTIQFANTHMRYGEPLGALPTVQQKIGQLQSGLMAARTIAYHATYMLDQGQPCDAELMNAKLINVESLIDATRTAMEIHAAHGLSAGYPLERYVRDAQHPYAPAGTSDIQRLRLAEIAMGSDRTPWSQRFATELAASSSALSLVPPAVLRGVS